MFFNDSYIRKFPMYESNLLADLSFGNDGSRRDREGRVSLIDRIKRVFQNK